MNARRVNSRARRMIVHVGRVVGVSALGLLAVAATSRGTSLPTAGAPAPKAPALNAKLVNAAMPQGYWMVASDGGIFPFGASQGFGSEGGTRLNQPVVGMASTPTGNGYWLVASDGGIFPFGDAGGFGSTGGQHLNQPIVGMAAMPDGKGYWLVASDGGIFPFGDATQGLGSEGGTRLNQPIVGMAATATGKGYWLVAADGGIFPHGDAGGYGSEGGTHLNQPIVGMAPTASGHGYWLVASDGGIFPHGDAGGFGSTGGMRLNQPIVGMGASPTGLGYWLVAADGGIFPFGDAQGIGSEGGTRLNQPIVGMAAYPPLPPTSISISPNGATSLTADQGAAGLHVTVHVTNKFGNPSAGASIIWSRSGLANSGLSAPSATTDNGGNAGVTLFDTHAGDTGAVTATVANSSVNAATGTISITPGNAAQVVFTTSPSSSTGGVAFPTQPVVSIRDSYGNVETADNGAVTLSITSGTGAVGATLSCTTNPVNASGGVATFSGCKIDKAATGYTLTATHGSLHGASAAFNIAVGPAAQLAFTTQPSSSTGGIAFPTQPAVSVEDAGGNVVTTDSSNVTLSITAATGTAGATLSCTSNPTAASSGVASFAGCKIDKAGSNYQLHALDGSLSAVNSSAFNIAVGPVAKLAFTTQPGNGTGGTALPTQPAVSVEDAGGNTVTTDSSNVTLSITGGTGTGGAALTCTTNPLAASSGVAAFAGCKIDKAGSNYQLHAIDGSLTAADSATFNITVGPAAKLAFTTQPGNGTGGTALPTQPTVTVQDAGGNTVTTDSSGVTLSITGGTGTGGAALTCTSNPTSASSGVAGFAGCKIDKAGSGYTLTAIDGSLAQAVSSAFNVTVGPAAKLAVTTQPSNGTGGVALPTQPAVTVQDAGGNTVTTDTSGVTLSITGGTGTAGAALACSANPLAATAGVASFSGCNVDKAGSAYTLTAIDGSLTQAVSNAFNISVGPAAKLAFTTQPSNSTGGTAFGTQPVVTVEDAGGNTVTTDGSSVSLAIRGGTGTAGATLSCTTNPLGASSGVAGFSGCAIDKAGSSYQLHASDGVLTAADSAAFNITVGSAAKLAFTTQPSNGTGGVALPTQPTVTVEDAGGNTVTTDSSSVTLSITSGTGTPGAALSCTSNPLAASSGVAGFAGCKIDKAGTSYKLHAVDGGLTLTDSLPFDIGVGPAAKLGFTQQPGGGSGGTALATQPIVAVQDAGGNTVTTDGSNVTLSITPGTGTGGAVLTCTPNPVAASSGLASFGNCSIDKAGTGYRLHAIDGSLTAADSATFTITAGTAAKVVFTQQPSGSTGGVAFGTQPTVTVEDAGGNPVTSDASAVTLSITSGTGTAGAALTCTSNPVVASSGVATFAGCKIDKAGSNYQLHAIDGTLTPANSSAINITVGAAAKLVFTTQPSSSAASQAPFAQQPVVTVQDAGGNTVTTDGSSVTLSITTGTGTVGAALTCTTNTVAASSGVATFAGCKVDKAGTGYTLHAIDGGLAATDSSAFAITPATASKLAVTTSPSNSTGGTAFGTQPVVTVEDASGNTVTGDSSSITLSITGGTGTGGATLTCTTNPVAASSGVATFAGCKIDKAGSNYQLHAIDTTLTPADSATFNVTVGPAAQLVFTQQPGNSTGGVAFPTQPVVTVEDAGGNTVTTDSSTVALAKAGGTPTSGGPGTLSGCTPNESAGVVTFSGCKINTVGTGYKLVATDTVDGLTTPSAPSSAFNISVGPATQVGFSVQPSDAVSQVAIAPAIQIQVQDAGGNLVSSATNGIGVVLTTAGGATLSGTTSHVSSGGVAVFNDLSVDKAGTYTLTASSTGLNGAVSISFTITHGPAAQLFFTTSPSSSTGGVAFGTQPIVTVADAAGNTVTNDSSLVTLSVTPATGTAGAKVSCTTNPLAASAGVASFVGCSVDKAGSNYQLHATDGSLTPVDSATFNITVGPPALLAFTTQPSTTSASQTAFAQQPVVSIEDAGGNVTGDTSTVVLSITSGTGTAGAVLACTPSNSLAATAGQAGFTGCKVDKVGSGYTLHATDGSLTPADSTAFAITPGIPSKLVFTTSPSSSTGGIAFGTQPVVTVEDSGGNTVTSDNTSTVTLSITGGTGTAGATLTCTGNTVVVSSGVATFAGCRIDKAGSNYKLHAVDGALTAADSATFNITVGPAAQVGFTQQPSNSTGGVAFGTQPTVAVQDAGGNTVTTDSSAITLTITPSTGTAGAALTCTTNPLAASSGVAAFAGCKIDKAGNNYQLHAADGVLNAADSTTFNITVGPAAKLAFTTQPSASSVSQTAFAQQPAVSVEDAGGNTVTTDSSNVTLSLTGGTGGAVLTCTTNPVAASSGVATFAGCKVDKAGTGYTLHAIDGTLTATNSTAFAITPGAASKLAFTTGPSNSTGGVAFGTQPVVAVEDASGNTVTTDSSSVTLTITPTTGTAGATLTCTTNPLGATSGVAGFAGCKIDKAGNAYQLHAADGGLTVADSTAFNITVGPASKLAFTQQPSSSTGGIAFGTQPTVAVEDAGGNTVTGDSSNVTLSITTSTGTAGAALTCTTNPLAASSGVAAFGGCAIDKAGNNYQLHASDSSLTTADSTAFNITVGAAAKLAFTTQPSGSTGGVAFATQPVVAVEDAGGNTVTTDSSAVTLTIKGGTGTAGAALTCATNPVNASSGVATFGGCKIDKAGSNYQLHAADGSLTVADSTAFNIAVGPANKLVFTQQPVSSTGGIAFGTQPKVTVEDAGGNIVSTDSSNVTLSITGGTGTSGAALTCTTNPLAASSGVAAFAGCKIDKAGTNYQLHAADGGLATADSTTFNINVGPSAQLAFTQQPSSSTGGVAFGTQPTVTVEDAGGNTVTTDTSGVTLSITGGTGTAGANLTCTANPTNAAAGVATFAGCKVDKAGTGYTLTANDNSLAAATSTTFDVTVGPAAQVAFTQQPTSSTGGITFGTQPKVTVQDAGGNTVTTDSSSVTLSITGGTGTGGAALTCTTNPLAATSGVAAFGGCKIDKAGTNYKLHAIDGSLTAADSNAFNISVGPAAQVAFTQQPTSSTGGIAFGTQPTVTVEDAGGNTVTGDSSNVTLSITTSTGTAGAALTCTTNPLAASAGVASFAGCKIDKAGSNYQLHAIDGTLTAADSTAFNITVGPAAKLGFTQQPSSSAGGTAFATQPKVAVQDAGGNTVTTDSSTVTLSITPATGTAGAALTCTTNPLAASSGVAAFAGCKIDKAGTNYQLHAIDGALTAADSATFNITAGAAAKVVFTQQPTSSTGGVAFGTQPIVTVEDSGGNTVTTDSSNVTLSITPATGTAGAALTCTTNPLAASSGVATFGGCAIDKAGTGYTLHAIDGALTSADSTPINITVGPAAKLAFTQQPSSSTGGTAFGTQPTVTVEDAGGNTVTTDTSPVSLVIKTGTGALGAALSCTTNPVNATAGVAAFAGCKIDKASSNYQLHATDGSLTAADSTAFNITVGAVSQLVFGQQPTDTAVTAAITPAVTVILEDAGGNTVTTANNLVSMVIGTNTTGGTLSGTTAKAASSGVATFSDLSIDKPSTNYTLTASVSGPTITVNSSSFKEIGPPNHLAFVAQPPASTTAGQTMTSFTVAVEDAAGNVLTNATNNVAITSVPLTTVNGTTTRAPVNGIATFNDISINQSGTYHFTANSTALSPDAQSNNFTINPAAATHATCTLGVTATPCGTTFVPTANTAQDFKITLRDQFENALDSTNATTYNVTVTLTANPTGTPPSDGGTIKVGAGLPQGPAAPGVPATLPVTIGPGSGSATITYTAPAVLPPGGRGTIHFANGASTTLSAFPADIAVNDP